MRHFDRRIKNIETSMKYIIISLLLLTSSILFSQSNEDILKFSYGMAKDFQIGSSEKVKSVEFNPKKVFIKSKYSKDTLFSVLDFFEKDIKVSVNQKDETIEIDIPKGISDSEMMSMRGKGQYIKNGVHGDLIIIITEKPHDKFKRNGIDLIQKIKLPYEDLVLGNTIDIDTIDKKIRITIKPGSQIGEILRVSGKGLIRDGRIGDMLIELSLDIPTNPSEEYINKINDLKNIR